MNESFYKEKAKLAAKGCFSPSYDAEKYAMQVIIENLVLDEDVSSYSEQEMEKAILKKLKERGVI